ncbi:MAG: Uma2 family endonuclease, partial [Actinomycetota bacterium]
GNIFFGLESYVRRAGGRAFIAPLDVYFADDNVVEPDVLFVGQDRAEQIAKKHIRDAPDLVVEVSSPSTRRLELVRKRELYQRFGVPEYWYIDLDADRVEVYRLTSGSYIAPELLYPGDLLTSPHLPGFAVAVEEALATEL